MPFLIDFFVFLHLYGLYTIVPGFIVAIAYMIRVFSFPLITRNSNEIVLMIGPNKVKFYKVKERLRPLFTLKDGAYWFWKPIPVTAQAKIKTTPKKPFSFKKQKIPLETVEPEVKTVKLPFAQNKVHIYDKEINQPITHLERVDTKVTDASTHYQRLRQVVKHAVQIPPSIKWVFWRNWILEIQSDDTAILEATTEKQPLKVNFFIRMSVITPEIKATQVPAESLDSGATQQSITMQTIVQKVGDIEKNTNFSAAYALDCIKVMRKMHSPYWLRILMGKMDMKMLFILIAAIGMIGAIFLFYSPPSLDALGPPPAGCTNC